MEIVSEKTLGKLILSWCGIDFIGFESTSYDCEIKGQRRDGYVVRKVAGEGAAPGIPFALIECEVFNCGK
jgi:hypothetical protein